MPTYKTYFDSAANLSRDLNAVRTVHGAPLYVTYNAHPHDRKLVVYTWQSMKVYIPKKYDGYEVLFRSWDGSGQPWLIEFFQFYC